MTLISDQSSCCWVIAMNRFIWKDKRRKNTFSFCIWTWSLSQFKTISFGRVNFSLFSIRFPAIVNRNERAHTPNKRICLRANGPKKCKRMEGFFLLLKNKSISFVLISFCSTLSWPLSSLALNTQTIYECKSKWQMITVLTRKAKWKQTDGVD